MPNHPNRRVIWTRAAYELLYEELRRRFGPLRAWSGSYPTDRKAEYAEFCNQFAALVGAKSETAVTQQVAFVLPLFSGAHHHWDNSHSRIAIQNIAAAFWAGFIDNSHFPRLEAFGPSALTDEAA